MSNGIKGTVLLLCIGALCFLLGTQLFAKNSEVKSHEGYDLVFQDEFDGDSLNLNDWNVEAHDPGWVNAELQSYPDADHCDKNIYLEDGHLVIKPIATKKDSSGEASATNLLSNPAFAGDGTPWIFGTTAPGMGSVEFADGKASVKVNSPGEQNWHVQLQQGDITLAQGHTYHFCMNAVADVDRWVEIAFVDPDNDYLWYGGLTIDVTTKETVYEFDLDCSNKPTSSSIALQFNYGLIGGSKKDSMPAAVSISDVALTDLAGSDVGERSYDSYSFSSGRIDTENKHNFTYGFFEARAKVPEGRGYLPAFWLMSANENPNDEYGIWPACGEIDIMEVLGDETSTTYGTLHFGNPHDQRQGVYELAKGSFSDDYHLYQCEWQPGKISWYVDGQKFYETSDWFSAKEEGKPLAYPAPFDHDMYIILNLAVGGNWVGYPDQAAIDDMANQEYDIDYVRVYQKSEYD